VFRQFSPLELVLAGNNQNWNQNLFLHYWKQHVFFCCFASVSKQQVSVFWLNQNKQKTNEKIQNEQKTTQNKSKETKENPKQTETKAKFVKTLTFLTSTAPGWASMTLGWASIA
jgi:hypothetical protein